MRRAAVILVPVLAAAVAFLLRDPEPERPLVRTPAAESGWSELDPQGRCDRAAELITHPKRWPVLCRWRNAGEQLAAQAFPPPEGPPPYDHPRVEVYVSPAQTREDLARAIAHELGHMHHTREPAFVPDWLAARGLDGQTPSEVWAEDYAEVFAALFAPPSAEWRAPTPRPSPDALAVLRDRFFS